MKYAARFEGPFRTDSVVVICARDAGGERTFQRPLYTMMEAVETAVWLNERAKGYPIHPNLDHLYNGRG
jgi:delta-aminolevulinic acid dehydratase/porphobilinogen synthase